MDSCRSRADFAALRRGRRFDSELLWLTFAADGGLPGPRVAFALSRRRGTAVMRNRARRRLRALFRELAVDLMPGRYLVGVRAAASTVTYRRARSELVRLLSAAGALSPSAESTQA
ncbi:ribonuclease P protein component [Candidatus Poriferisodalis sp.]|uniref:ribonuclease P protein component n=1 Tax=Candidatus Poriferisodalis sp. TaxID=3101277 RepID=UPI003B015CB0